MLYVSPQQVGSASLDVGGLRGGLRLCFVHCFLSCYASHGDLTTCSPTMISERTLELLFKKEKGKKEISILPEG